MGERAPNPPPRSTITAHPDGTAQAASHSHKLQTPSVLDQHYNGKAVTDAATAHQSSMRSASVAVPIIDAPSFRPWPFVSEPVAPPIFNLPPLSSLQKDAAVGNDYSSCGSCAVLDETLCELTDLVSRMFADLGISPQASRPPACLPARLDF